MTERWLPVVGNASYEISDFGNIRRTVPDSRNRFPRRNLRPFQVRNGYLQVRLAGSKERSLHRIVAAAFLGPCPPGMQVDHIDGNRSHNAIGNLRYVTPAENNVAGLRRNGGRPGAAKLTRENVLEAREMRQRGHTFASIAERFGVAECTIQACLNGRNWRYFWSITNDEARRGLGA